MAGAGGFLASGPSKTVLRGYKRSNPVTEPSLWVREDELRVLGQQGDLRARTEYEEDGSDGVPTQTVSEVQFIVTVEDMTFHDSVLLCKDTHHTNLMALAKYQRRFP